MLSVCSSLRELQSAPLCVTLQCFKRLQQPATCQRTLSALYSLCVSIFSTCPWQTSHLYSVCVYVWLSETWQPGRDDGQSAAAAKTRLSSILPLPSLLCVRQKQRSLSLREHDRKGGVYSWTVRCSYSTCWICVSGLAVAQISQPGREGLLMKVHEGQDHSVCWEDASSHMLELLKSFYS